MSGRAGSAGPGGSEPESLAYLIYSFTDFLAPSSAARLTPWIQFPAPLAEGAFALWLLAFGVNLDQHGDRCFAS